MPEEYPAEIRAMFDIDAAMNALSPDERARVVSWIISKFRGTASGGARSVSPDSVQEPGAPAAQFEDLAEFYSVANPDGDQEKALVGAYWLQFHEGADDVDAMTVNTRLKHLGHGIGNITRAFETLKALKPAMIVQTRKEGKTQQARKKFKVTAEGKKRVLAMVKANLAG